MFFNLFASKHLLIILIILHVLLCDFHGCEARNKMKKRKRKNLDAILSQKSKKDIPTNKNESAEAITSALKNIVNSAKEQQEMWANIQGTIDDSFQLMVVIGGSCIFTVLVVFHIVTVFLLVTMEKSMSKKIGAI